MPFRRPGCVKEPHPSGSISSWLLPNLNYPRAGMMGFTTEMARGGSRGVFRFEDGPTLHSQFERELKSELSRGCSIT